VTSAPGASVASNDRASGRSSSNLYIKWSKVRDPARGFVPLGGREGHPGILCMMMVVMMMMMMMMIMLLYSVVGAKELCVCKWEGG
jgi:hypothetical protein